MARSLYMLTIMVLSASVVIAQEDSDKKSTNRVLVFHVQNAPAREIAEVISQVMRDREITVVADAISNRLLVSCKDKVAEDVGSIIKELDSSPQVLAIEIVIAKLGKSKQRMPADAVLDLNKSIEGWQKSGDLQGLDHINMTTVENVPATVQVTKNMRVASGRTFSRGGTPGRGEPSRPLLQYHNQQFGTLVKVQAKLSGREVVMEISVEKSSLSAAAATDDAAPSSGGMSTLTLQSTVRAALGKTTLVASQSGDDHTFVVLARVQPVRDSRGPAHAADKKPDGRTVFYLKMVDALQAAKVVKELIPEGDVQITVDARTNALFVTAGNKKSLDDVEKLLQQLDRKAKRD